MKTYSFTFTQTLKSAFGLLTLAIIFLLAQNAAAVLTLPFYDSIPSAYTEGGQLGAAGVGEANWTAGASGASLTVAAASALTYSGLQEPPAGSRGITYTSSGALNRGVNFTAVSSGKVYCSFLIKVTASLASGNRLIASLHSSTSASSTPECAIIMTKIGGSNGSIGVGKKLSSYLGTTGGLGTTTNLVVVRYTFVDGDANDTLDLWLNPGSFGATEANVPAATLADLADASKADAASLNTFFLHVGSTAAAGISFDEIRIGTTWADVTTPPPCITAGISSGPNNQTSYLDTTATFNISATGLDPTFNWQLSTDGGTVFSDTGAASSTNYTTPTLTGSENGYKYRCIVTTPCNSLSVTSAPATLTVVNGATISFRSVASDLWSKSTTWEQSLNGITWTNASGAPTSANSNITVRAGHTVTVSAPVTVDQLVVQAGGEVDVNGTTFTINPAGGSPDAAISGILKLTATAGSTVTADGAALQFENGGKFTSALATAIAIPPATWATNSTCEIAPATAGAAVPTGLEQSFGNFTWNWPNMSGSVIVGALATINGNFTVTTTNSANAGGLKLNNGGSQTLTVGGNVHVAGGYLCLMGSSTFATETLNIGGDLIIDSGAYFDGRNSAGSTINIVFTNPNGPKTHVLNNAGTIGHSSGTANKNFFAWQVTSTDTLLLDSDFMDVGPAANGQSTIVVDGTLNCNGHVLGGDGLDTLTVSSSGTLIGNGTTHFVTAVGAINFNGTLNLPGLPDNLNNGDPLALFSASSYSGLFANISPATTPTTGFTWDQSQIAVNGTLYVGAAGAAAFEITSYHLVGDQLTLTGSGGTPYAGFSVLTSTNAATPIGSWGTWMTGSFDDRGNFSVTSSIDTGNSQSYYRISE
jgi:hypothetical protein